MSRINNLEMLCMLTGKISEFFSQLSETLIKEMGSQHIDHPHVNGVVKAEPHLESPEPAVEPTQQPKRNRALKKKDPLMPKAPTSSYLLFFKEKRPELKQTYGDCSSSELTKLASQEWMNLPQEQKQKYIDMSTLEKERYYKQMGKFKEGEGSRKKEKKTNSKKEKKTTPSSKEPEKISESVKEISSSSSLSSSSSSSSSNSKKEKKTGKAVIEIPSQTSQSQDSLGAV